jgi:16S rRNA G966 N2-methylase RsmD
MSRESISPIQDTVADERQAFARHYGVHPYFTRRSANVVRTYLERYTALGDTVADPFGGSGVTAIEALLMGRHAVQNDLNPFANFICQAIADTTLSNLRPLREAFQRLTEEIGPKILAIEKADEAEVDRTLRAVPLPENIPLPRSSDAEHFHGLFTPRQLAGLAVLKEAIGRVKPAAVRQSLLLAWSATAAKLNRTFLSAKGRTESRGGSSIFSIYRYKLAASPVELPIWETFQGRFDNVVRAKQEVLQTRDHFNATHGQDAQVSSRDGLRVYALDAPRLLDRLGPESVDYVFTDPPYGGYIAYLDLSVLWNHWLGFRVADGTRAAEAIVGGDLKLTEDHYKRKLAASVRCCVDLLKPDRWMSVVFQHWDVSYFDTILVAAHAQGADLRATVTQEREVIWSMHKKKNRENLLTGEMILTFYKPARPHSPTEVRESCPVVFDRLLDQVLTECRERTEVTSQYLFNRVILAAWNNRSMSELAVTRETFMDALRRRGWSYDTKHHAWRRGGTQPERRDLFAE